jgi:hypothetical protein
MDFITFYYLSAQDKEVYLDSLPFSARGQYQIDYDRWFYDPNNPITNREATLSRVINVSTCLNGNLQNNSYTVTATASNIDGEVNAIIANFELERNLNPGYSYSVGIDSPAPFLPCSAIVEPIIELPRNPDIGIIPAISPSSRIPSTPAPSPAEGEEIGPSPSRTQSISLVARYCDNGTVSGRSKFITIDLGVDGGDAFFNNSVSIASLGFARELREEGFSDVRVGTQFNLPSSPICSDTGINTTSQETKTATLLAYYCDGENRGQETETISYTIPEGAVDNFFSEFVRLRSERFRNTLLGRGFKNINIGTTDNPPANPTCKTTREILLRASFCNNGVPEYRGKAVSIDEGLNAPDSFFANFVSIQTIVFENELRSQGYTEVNVTSGVNPPNPVCNIEKPSIAQVLASVQFRECNGSFVNLTNNKIPAPSLTINGRNLPLDKFGPTTYDSTILGDFAYIYRELTSIIYSNPGTYTVTFGNIPGWVTPPQSSFSLASINDSGGGNAIGVYVRQGCEEETIGTFGPSPETTGPSPSPGPSPGPGTPPPPPPPPTTTTLRIPETYWLKRISPLDNKKYVFDITEGLFSNNIRNLVTFFTGSSSDTVNKYYTHIYDENPKTSLTSSIQFSIAYGHSGGSGSLDEGNKINITPTRAIYGQYRNLILGRPDVKFNLTGKETDSIYVINYQSKRLKNKLDAGVLELNIAHLSGSQFLAGGGTIATHTGSNVKLAGNNRVLRLIDDSKININPDYTDVGYSYNIVSGTLETGVYNESSPHYYGKIIPSLGVVILDGNKLDLSASFATSKASEIEGYNALKLYKSFSGSALVQDISGDYLGMKARRIIREYNDYYFIRLNNREFNFTNNNSYFIYNKKEQIGNPGDLTMPLDPNSPEGIELNKRLTETNGEIFPNFVNNPQVYITTVGLYNAQRELVAVGKLTKPILKNFTEESIFTVKLKY